MSMTFPELNAYTVVGVNHWKAPVDVREKFNMSNEESEALLDGAEREGIQGLVVISTCNRTEIFAQDASPHDLVRLLTTYSRGTLKEFRSYGFEFQGQKAVKHLFKVATGLDSQILGDLQIVKQVKEGYRLSTQKQMVDGTLHRLMQHLFRAHKRSRTETSLGDGAATIAYAAVKFATRTFDNLADRSVLLVGTGKIGKVTCKNLLNLGVRKITLVNRTRERAEMIADRLDVEVAGMEALPEQLAQADLVIVATGASEPVVTLGQMEIAGKDPRYRMMLDLSVPRNIDPKVGELPFVDLANIDMLSDVTNKAHQRRQKEVPLVKQIIEEELGQFGLWLREQRVVPTIKALVRKFDRIREEEVEFFRNRLSETDVEKVENLTRRIVNKIAAYSIEHLRDHHHSDEVARLVEEMFKLGPEYGQENGRENGRGEAKENG